MSQSARSALLFLVVILGALGAGRAELPETHLPSDRTELAGIELDVLRLDAATKSSIDEKVGRSLPQELRTRRLHEFLFSAEGIGIVYDASRTKSAQEAFAARSGNCLSLAHLFVAAARHLGLDARYQIVDVPRQWTRVNGLYSIPGHVNVIVRMPGRDRAVVELIGASFTEAASGRLISDREALAIHYSNLGAEALTRRDDALAIANLKKATELDADLRFAWSNLGAVYRLTKRYEAAEHAYLRALALDHHDSSSIQNIHALYLAWGRHDQAEKYEKQALRLARENPYNIARSAEQALREGRLRVARGLYKKAIRSQPQEHEFYLGLARVYLELGAMHKAGEMLANALEVSTTSEAQLTYLRKLEALAKVSMKI